MSRPGISRRFWAVVAGGSVALLLVAVAMGAWAGAAEAANRPPIEVQIEPLERLGSVPVPPKEIKLDEVGEEPHGVISTIRLVELAGVMPSSLESMTVETPGSTTNLPQTLDREEALDGIDDPNVPEAPYQFADFESGAHRGNEVNYKFAVPPHETGAEPTQFEAVEEPLLVRLKLETEELGVERPEFSPGEPHPEEWVSFEAPAVTYLGEPDTYFGDPDTNDDLEYSWSFPGGKTSTEPSPKFKFSEIGEPIVSVGVTDPEDEATGYLTFRVKVTAPGEPPCQTECSPSPPCQEDCAGEPGSVGHGNSPATTQAPSSQQHTPRAARPAENAKRHAPGPDSSQKSSKRTQRRRSPRSPAGEGGQGGGGGQGQGSAISSKGRSNPPAELATSAPASSGLVGTPLESSAAGLPGSRDAASAPGAGRKSTDGRRHPGDVLAWVAGCTLLVALLSLGALLELQPRARHRRLRAS